MTTAAEIIAQIQAQREQWVPVADGKRMRIRRPAEAEIGQWRNGIDVGRVASCVVGWDGFTEADLLGPSIGSSGAVLFDPALCAEVLRDRVEWIALVSDAIVAAIQAHLETREAARKNSQPS